LVEKVDAIVLSVKPNDIKTLLKDISSHLTRKHLVLSIVAGVKLDDLHQVLGLVFSFDFGI
jgi:pyrroline-5-carboxylate reductase